MHLIIWWFLLSLFIRCKLTQYPFTTNSFAFLQLTFSFSYKILAYSQYTELWTCQGFKGMQFLNVLVEYESLIWSYNMWVWDDSYFMPLFYIFKCLCCVDWSPISCWFCTHQEFQVGIYTILPTSKFSIIWQISWCLC